jgi:chemotaxis protein MotB
MPDKPRLWEGFSFWPSFADFLVVLLLYFVFSYLVQSTQATLSGLEAKDAQQCAQDLIDANINIDQCQSRLEVCENRVDVTEGDLNQCQSRLEVCENRVDVAEGDLEQCRKGEAWIAAQVLKRQEEMTQEVTAALGQERNVLSIVVDGNLQRFQFSDRLLFNLGEADLLPRGREVLRRVGEVLRRNVDRFQTAQVEGHTDVRPIRTPRFPSNWELSSARATSVVRFFQDEVGFDPKVLSANGYAEYRPIATGDSEEAYAKNRRVELVLVYSTEEFRRQLSSTRVPSLR